MPRELAFTENEYRQRILRLQSILREREIDALLCTIPANVCYFTGYESVAVEKFWLVVIPAEREPHLLIQDFESHNARLTCWLDTWSTYPVGGDPIEAAARVLRELWLDRNCRLGVELDRLSTLSAGEYIRLRNLIDSGFVDAAGIVDSLRAIKSPAEIEHVRRAGAISAAAMNAAIAAAREGASDNDVAAAGYQLLHAMGSEYMCYPWFVTVGPRSGVPHTTFRRTQLKPGDPVFLEVGACICRYSAPMMRTAVIGEPSATLRGMADACIASVKAMIESIRPGVTGDFVASRAETALNDRLRYLPPGLVWHGYYGYSVGLGFPITWADSAQTMIARGSQTVLQEGMTFHANTSLREIGERGTAFSETILVTAGGCEVLTDAAPRKLVVR